MIRVRYAKAPPPVSRSRAAMASRRLRVDIGERPVGVEHLQHCGDRPRIASKALENFAEDRLIAGARYIVFGAGRNHHFGETSQRAALILLVPDAYARTTRDE
jgi:hypothetical protein